MIAIKKCFFFKPQQIKFELKKNTILKQHKQFITKKNLFDSYNTMRYSQNVVCFYALNALLEG